MESSDVAHQLAEAERLRDRTVSESLRGKPAALPVLAIATVAYFASYEVEAAWVQVAAPLAWVVFILLWVRWLRAGNRVQPRFAGLAGHRRDWREDLPLWLALVVAANIIALLGAAVSWLLAGILMASLGTAAGIAMRGRSSR